MEFPPTPFNMLLAYTMGKITKDELLNMLKLWEEKNANKE